MPNLGLRDIPLENINDESLGLKEYIEALSDFILQCETPLTVALQGDWGSGKTSFMNLIQTRVKPNVAQTVWFNSWQYSQFGMQSDLALSMIYHFVNELGTDDEGKVKNLLSGLMRVGKAVGVGVAIGGANVFGAGEIVKGVTDHMKKDEEISEVMLLNNLKKKLDELVKKKIGIDGNSRIVVFVDDLDRLLPEKAVELLEVFKLFLEIPGCVYVLACDYHVIEEGLKKKFNLDSKELKGKSFFDKIIQLPFTMPLGQYDVLKYLKTLFSKIGVQFENDDLVTYLDLIKYSIGFNPRSMKRLFNSLQLLNIVADKKKIFDEQTNSATRAEKQKIMFGVLCLQTAYEPVYRYLQLQPIIKQETLEALRDEDKLKTDKEFDEIRKDLNDPDVARLRKLAQFMETFVEVVQLKSDGDKGKLSEQEAATIKQLLSFSSLTSTNAFTVDTPINTEERYRNKDIVKRFIEEELNLKYATYLDTIKDIFKVYQPRGSEVAALYFNFKNNDTIFELYFFIDSARMWCSWQAKGAKSVSPLQAWFDKSEITTFFPDKIYVPQFWQYDVWKKEFDTAVTREQREQDYKAEVIKTLDFLLPKFAEELNRNG